MHRVGREGAYGSGMYYPNIDGDQEDAANAYRALPVSHFVKIIYHLRKLLLS
jgi:hypothetical protein